MNKTSLFFRRVAAIATLAAVSCQIPAMAYRRHCHSLPQEELPRPVTSVYRVGIGHGSALSTYLSPLTYSGTVIGVSGEWSKAFNHNPEHIVMRFAGGLNFRDMLNPPGSASMLGLDGSFNWGLAWRQRLPKNFQITAGADLDITGGALYLTRNGNNPVTAMAYAGLDLSTSLSWNFRIGRLPVLVTDRVALPTLGAFFCPEYGETYYEIYLGNRKGLAHCGWWGNAFGIDNMLSFKLDFGRTALEVGYRFDYRSYWANSLSTRVFSNSFVIGVIPQGLGLKKRRRAAYAGY